MSTTRDTTSIAGLVERLDRLGVDLPPEVGVAGAQRSRIHGIRAAQADLSLPNLIGLDDEAMGAVLRDLAIKQAIRDPDSSGPLSSATTMLARALEDQIADQLAAAADEILDQLRPAFDKSAAAVHAAAELGITPSTTDTDIVKAENVAPLAAAWTSMVGHTATLQDIAEARLDLTAMAGAPPALEAGWLNPFPSVLDKACSMFSDDAPPWRLNEWETPWQRWLRLCTTAPARLLTTTASVQAWKLAKQRDQRANS